MIDQKGVGAALERVSAGILLSKHTKPQRIRSAIETVLHDNSYREAAERVGAQIRQRNGADVAADAIGEFVSNRQFADS
jgi:UDP:flavonoid glycosyltransferase YjiC (YdhE family)